MKVSRPTAPSNFGEYRLAAFTVVELLVVVAIIGLMAAVALPAIKGLGKSNAISAADRQLLDDIAFARQRALAEHTDVYMLFASSNILSINWDQNPPQYPLLTLTEKRQITNVQGLQYSGYALYVRRTVGDQPGQATGRYLTSWRSLPNGIFIRTNKFFMADKMLQSVTNNSDGISPFRTNSFPFPTVTNQPTTFAYLQFDHLGQLADPQDNGSETIPFVRGSAFYDKNYYLDFLETPPGNAATNSTTFNHVRIDGLTGRGRIEHYKIQ